MKIKYYCFLLTLLISATSFAQKLEVKGNVSGADGVPLIGASVVEKGTSNGTQTDFDGNFTLSVNPNAVLIVSYVGYTAQEISANPNIELKIVLEENTNQLDEVVVVAQGITKSRKALGYAISKVDTEETEGRPEADISRVLQGKISGVQITAPNGSSGSATSIVVRGNLSLNQSNQALIVVDNIIFEGNLLDIDPNNIQDITVLKGLNAAVLYGDEGRNGVILIQTKSGNAKLGQKSFTATVSQVSYTNQAANLPEFQNTFGVGNNLVTDAASFGNVGSNGARFSDLDVIPHPLSNDSRFPEFANAVVPFVPARDNVNDFFKTGFGTTTSLSISATGEKTSLNFALAYTGEDGIIGSNEFTRFNISLGGTSQLTDNLKLSSSIRFNTRDRTSQDGGDLFENLYIIPRSLDLQNLPFQDPLTGENVYYRQERENPLWTLANTGRERRVDRFNATLDLNYKINDHHNIIYRGGLQTEQANVFDFRNRGGILTDIFGALTIEADTDFRVDNTLIFGSNYAISEKIGFNSQLGITSRFERGTAQESDYTDQIVFGFFRPSNFRTTAVGDFDTFRENRVGFFGQADFNYDTYLFLGLSSRLDISSNLESANQTQFYPGVSLSFIPTSAFENFGGNIVNYLKIRGAFATSAGFPGRFQTRNALASDPREFIDEEGNPVVTNSLFGRLANPNLGPELHREFEVGIEGNFFDNALTLETSLFTRISRDQIFETELARSTGFDNTLINAGRVDTEGIEIDLGVKLFRKGPFNWDIRNTFTSFNSEVVELANGIQQVDNAGDNNDLIVGEELGSFFGDYILRDTEGNILVDPNSGELIESDNVGLPNRVIGNRTPDWRATSIHSFSYKNFRLSAQLEYTHGGDLNSLISEQLIERGVTRDTENREGLFVIPGVLGDLATGEPILDANGNTIPNTIQITGNNAYFSNFFDTDDINTFDASVFRIREVALSYTLDRSVFEKLPFNSIVFTLTGRNIFFYTPNLPKYINEDPENTGFNVPTTKRYAFGVSFNF